MTQAYEKELADHLANFTMRWTDGELRSYLSSRSRLPGPRANLELAGAFAEAVCGQPGDWKTMWTLCTRWTAIAPKEAPTNDPLEFVVFCGVRGVGALGAGSSARAREALSHLRGLARDPRWRVREAVAMALQDILESHPDVALRAFRAWVAPGAWLEMRAVAAGLAEPRVLRERKVARAAVEMHEDMLKRFRAAKERDSDEFRSLRQCLAYSVSVVVAAAPEEGFRWMMRLAEAKDPDVLWILKENSKKSRLADVFPGRVERIRAIMRHG